LGQQRREEKRIKFCERGGGVRELRGSMWKNKGQRPIVVALKLIVQGKGVNCFGRTGEEGEIAEGGKPRHYLRTIWKEKILALGTQ